jgi:lysozyme
MRPIPHAALDLIMRYEGLKCVAYLCPAGKWTIGYGTTGDKVYDGLVITPAVAEQWLMDHVDLVAKEVLRVITAPLNDNEFAALISFAYNVGVGNLAGSTLAKLLNAHKYAEAAEQFLRWTKGGGRELPGLVARRAAEREMFLRKPAEVV